MSSTNKINKEIVLPETSGKGVASGNEDRRSTRSGGSQRATPSTSRASSKSRDSNMGDSKGLTENGDNQAVVLLERIPLEQLSERRKSDDFTHPVATSSGKDLEEPGNRRSRRDSKIKGSSQCSGSVQQHNPIPYLRPKGSSHPRKGKAPSPSPAPSQYSTADDEEGDDTDADVMEEEEEIIKDAGKKKTRIDSESEEAIDVEGEAKGKPQASKKKREGPARGGKSEENTGKFVGLRAATRDAANETRDVQYARAEQELYENWTAAKITRSMQVLMRTNLETDEEDERELYELPAKDIVAEINGATGRLLEIASFKKGYKGTSQRVLKEVSKVILTAMKELSRRTQSEESKNLMAENAKQREMITTLQEQVRELREEVIAFRTAPRAAERMDPPHKEREVSPVPPHRREQKKEGRKGSKIHILDPKAEEDPIATLENSIVNRIGRMMDARFASINDRLLPEKNLRPPLKSDEGPRIIRVETVSYAKATKQGKTLKEGKGREEVTRTPRLVLPKDRARSERKKEGKKEDRKVDNREVPTFYENPNTIEETNNPPTIPDTQEEWTEIGKGGKRKRTTALTGKGGATATLKVADAKGKWEVEKKKGTGKSKERDQKDQKDLKVNGKKVGEKRKSPKITTPKRAAILISLSSQGENVMETTDALGKGSQRTLGDAVASVKGELNLADFGITALKPKRTATGDILYEVPGQDRKDKADKLAAALRAHLEPKGVRVTVPVKKAELRFHGIHIGGGYYFSGR